MKKFAVMMFNDNVEIQDFLSKHKDVKLFDKSIEKFLVVETENSDKEEYEEKIVARFISPNDKIIISSLDRYKTLSDNAKKIINCVKLPDEEPIKLQIGKCFSGINIDSDLYYEVLHFATDNGLNYARYSVDDGEEISICLNADGIVRLE